MARKGVSETDIREAIAQLESVGQAISVTQIREVLGTGSYSTISSVLQQWREEQSSTQRLAIPDVPDHISALLQRVWSEAWTVAHHQHELERRSFQEQKQAFADAETEMKQEIARLEGQNSEQFKELETLREVQMELVRCQAKVDALKLEISQLHEERSRSGDQLAEWVERCTKAETELQQLKRRRSKSSKTSR